MPEFPPRVIPPFPRVVIDPTGELPGMRTVLSRGVGGLQVMQSRLVLVVRVNIGGALLAMLKLTELIPRFLSNRGLLGNLAYRMLMFRVVRCPLRAFPVPRSIRALHPRQLTCRMFLREESVRVRATVLKAIVVVNRVIRL